MSSRGERGGFGGAPPGGHEGSGPTVGAGGRRGLRIFAASPHEDSRCPGTLPVRGLQRTLLPSQHRFNAGRDFVVARYFNSPRARSAPVRTTSATAHAASGAKAIAGNPLASHAMPPAMAITTAPP